MRNKRESPAFTTNSVLDTRSTHRLTGTTTGTPVIGENCLTNPSVSAFTTTMRLLPASHTYNNGGVVPSLSVQRTRVGELSVTPPTVLNVATGVMSLDN